MFARPLFLPFPARWLRQFGPLLTGLLSAALVAQPTGAAAVPFITMLSRPNYDSSTATGVSADGTIVSGTAFNSSGSGYEGYSVNFVGSSGTTHGFGFLQGDSVSTATGISGNGLSVVGYSADYAGVGYGGFLSQLNPLGGDNDSSAHGANFGGDAIVGDSTLSGIGGGRTEAAMWGGAGANPGLISATPLGLGFLPGYNSSEAYGVGGSPQTVVGYSSQFSGSNVLHEDAFVWRAGSAMRFLSGRPSGYSTSLAVGISADGSTAVGAFGNGTIFADGLGGAFFGLSARINGPSSFTYWNVASGNSYSLLSLPAGQDTYGIALAASANGAFVVGSIGNYTNGHGYSNIAIYDSVLDNHYYNLYDLMRNSGNPLTGWGALFEATGISGDGDTVVGYGSYNGYTRGFRISGMREAIYGTGTVRITSPPASQTVKTGSNVTFQVTAVGTGTLRYQWKKNGVPISGATSSLLILSAVQPGDAASYTVEVSNGIGNPAVAVAILTVLPGAPNLTPYKPAGWSDKVVVAKTTGTTTDGTGFLTSDTLYVDWAVINSGDGPTGGPFNVSLSVDGVLRSTFTVNTILNGGVPAVSTDYNVGTLGAGQHTILLVVDSGNAIAESDESDNTYTKIINVGSPGLPNIAPTKPAGWSDDIVVASAQGGSVDTFLYPTDTIYVDWAVINNGPVATGKGFNAVLRVDNVVKGNFSVPGSVGVNAVASYPDYSIGSYPAGGHTIEIEFDTDNAVTESNESDNTYRRTFSVGSVGHPAFFTGETPLSNGVYYLTLPNSNVFGYYTYLNDPHFIYHFDMGYEYWIDAADGHGGIYLYDFTSNDWFYTSPSFSFPYLYDFGLQAVLYYFPDPTNPQRYNTNGVRYFYNYSTHQIITK